MSDASKSPPDKLAQPAMPEIQHLTQAGMPFVVADTFSIQSDRNLAYLSLFKVEPVTEEQVRAGETVQAFCVGRFAMGLEAIPVLAKAFAEHLSKNAGTPKIEDPVGGETAQGVENV
jgi:hypothetical protein